MALPPCDRFPPNPSVWLSDHLGSGRMDLGFTMLYTVPQHHTAILLHKVSCSIPAPGLSFALSLSGLLSPWQGRVEMQYFIVHSSRDTVGLRGRVGRTGYQFRTGFHAWAFTMDRSLRTAGSCSNGCLSQGLFHYLSPTWTIFHANDIDSFVEGTLSPSKIIIIAFCHIYLQNWPWKYFMSLPILYHSYPRIRRTGIKW